MRGGRTGGGTKWRDNFEKLEGQNSCPRIPCEGGATSQKNGVKYRKLTLSVQLFQGCIMPQSPINSGFCVLLCRL